MTARWRRLRPVPANSRLRELRARLGHRLASEDDRGSGIEQAKAIRAALPALPPHPACDKPFSVQRTGPAPSPLLRPYVQANLLPVM